MNFPAWALSLFAVPIVGIALIPVGVALNWLLDRFGID
jgi:hypothetical protein